MPRRTGGLRVVDHQQSSNTAATGEPHLKQRQRAAVGRGQNRRVAHAGRGKPDSENHPEEPPELPKKDYGVFEIYCDETFEQVKPLKAFGGDHRKPFSQGQNPPQKISGKVSYAAAVTARSTVPAAHASFEIYEDSPAPEQTNENIQRKKCDAVGRQEDTEMRSAGSSHSGDVHMLSGSSRGSSNRSDKLSPELNPEILRPRAVGRPPLAVLADHPSTSWDSSQDKENEVARDRFVAPKPKTDIKNQAHEALLKVPFRTRPPEQVESPPPLHDPVRFALSFGSECEDSALHDESVVEGQAAAAVAPPTQSEPQSESVFESASSHFPCEYKVPPSVLEKERLEDAMFACPAYTEDIYQYLLFRESKCRIRPDYISKQEKLTDEMRFILIDWLCEVNQEYKLDLDSFFLAIQTTDRFLSLMGVKKDKLQLVGVTAMYIAAKVEQIYPPNVNEFAYITDDTFTTHQILSTEMLMLRELKYEMTYPHVYTFLSIYLKHVRADKHTRHLSCYLAELSAMDYAFLKYKGSIVAAAAVCLANLTTGRVAWSESIEEMSGYVVPDFYECMERLLTVFQGQSTSVYKAIKEKYERDEYFRVAMMKPPKSLPGL